MPEENVLVIPESVINAIGKIDGLERDVDRFLQPILASDQLTYQPRSQMETDPRFKQLIPYVLMEWTDRNSGEVKVFTYTRGGGGGESRLHARRSIGVGGHISEEDGEGGGDPYTVGMRRELDEEVVIESTYEDHREGLLYDDSNDVGRVHLGVIHRFVLEQPNVRSNESDLAEGEFVSIHALRDEMETLETWSQLCLQAIWGDG
ncbi:MAG: phosphoesterase [Planctomycetota bacterium]